MSDLKKTDVVLTLKKLNIVGTWEYDVENSMCPLCHQDLMCPKYSNSKIIKNIVLIGKCNHGYHDECIEKWLRNGNKSCTVCKTVWEMKKNVGSSVYIYRTANQQAQ